MLQEDFDFSSAFTVRLTVYFRVIVFDCFGAAVIITIFFKKMPK
jgi:hypothetical protein